MDTNQKVQKLVEITLQSKDIHQPEFFRLHIEEDKKRFNHLMESVDCLFYDQIYSQLREMIRSRNAAATFSVDEYKKRIEEHLNGCSLTDYGVWVYYPWSRRMVHILDENEFVEMRTSRNKYKITENEQNILSKKRVGVIGLSVGQSVSLTMAMERTAGELRIADYDDLEITNLNRLRSGLNNMGLLKTVLVAREIAEIDPFLKVTCFHEGINDDNLESFLLDNGKLDIVIDECDGVDIKINCRIAAKKHGITVVMEASDRGTIDIERFDLEPERPILHGYIKHLDISKLKGLKTNEEKLPYILPIAGVTTMSTRMKASAIEVGQTICTWPQLASAVTMGGGMTTDVCRRILLDELHSSGRYFIDLEQLICDKETTQKEPHNIQHLDGIKEAEMVALIKEVNFKPLANQFDPGSTIISELVQSAVMAPSGGNSQPWKWKYASKNLYLFLNSEYGPKLVDYKDTASFIGLGAASENLVLKAHKLNLEVKIDKFPLGDNSLLVSVFRFCDKGTNDGLESHVADDLEAFIPYRVANRIVTEKKPIANDRLDKLVKIARTIPGGDVRFATDSKDIAIIADLIGKANKTRILNKTGHLEFMAEIKWTTEEAEKSRKGIDLNTMNLTPGQRVGFNMVRNWDVIEYINKWEAGGVLERLTRKGANAASAIGLITMPSFSKENFLDGGRLVERLWLAAAKEKIAFQPMTVSTFLFARYLREGLDSIPKHLVNELIGFRKEFQRIFSIDDSFGEILLFRVFLSEPAERHSLRVSADEVLSFS